MNTQNRSAAETAIACQLSDDVFDRRRVEAGTLFRAAVGIVEIEDGVELEFPGDDDTAQALLDFVRYERRCCPTLSYALAFDKGHANIKLAMRGASGLMELVASWRSMSTGALRASCACA